jgi:hypothetical protein
MGNAPSMPSCFGGQVTLVGKSGACSAGLLEPNVGAGLPCTPHEYNTIRTAALPLGEAEYCQNGCSRPGKGDIVCASLRQMFPLLTFACDTRWIRGCEEYW